MSNRSKIKGEQNLRYNLTIWRENDAFDILNNISENANLVQLMDSLGNVNHAIIIVGNWIFYSNYKKSFCLTHVSLDIICYPSIGKKLLQSFDPYLMLLDTFGHQSILKGINMTLSSKILNTEKQMNIHIIFTYWYLIIL